MTKNLLEKLNDQMNFELYSAYIYLSMSIHLEYLNLNGMANWIKIQAKEEFSHADKIRNFLLEIGYKPTLKKIEQPQKQWESPIALFKNAYEHEQIVTSRIKELANLAIETNNHATYSFLQWFINEQIEEESKANYILNKLNMINNNTMGILMLDKELGLRKE